MLQASIGDGHALDLFAFGEDLGATAKVDISWLVVAGVVVVADEGRDLPFEFAGQIVVVEQDAVLERLMSALDLEAAFADDRARRAHGSCACRRARLASSSLTYELPLSLSSRGRCATVT
jgi:hypothetical protein